MTGIYIGYCQQTGTSPYYNSSCTGAGGNAGGSPTLVPTQDIVSTNQIVVPVPSGLGAGVYYPIVAYGTAPWSSPDPGSPGNPYAESGDEFTVS